MTALIAFIVISLAGFACLCVAVWMLAGLAWALVACGISLFCVAAFIRRGMIGG